MTQSYGINPTIIDPENLEGLADLRTSPGSARCCQFFTAKLPPSWYFFFKENTPYTNELIGVNQLNVGVWKSNLQKFSTVTSLSVPTAFKGLEVIELQSTAIAHEFDNTLNIVGGSEFLTGDWPENVVTPDYIGQLYRTTEGVVQGRFLVAAGLTSADWVEVSSGGSGS